MEWVEYLKASEIVLGIMLALFGALVSLFAWWDKRNRRYVDMRADTVTTSNASVASRLTKVENELLRIDKDVGGLRQQVAVLPSMADYTALKVEMADIGATLRQLNGMTTSLYQAAMRASEGGG